MPSSIVPNDGLDLIRDWLAGDTVDDPTHIAVGTGTATPLVTDTALVTEVLREVFSQVSKGTTGKVTFEMTLATTEANGNTLTEVGIFNAASAGDLLARVVFPGIAKTSSFELKIEVEITIQRKST